MNARFIRIHLRAMAVVWPAFAIACSVNDPGPSAPEADGLEEAKTRPARSARTIEDLGKELVEALRAQDEERYMATCATFDELRPQIEIAIARHAGTGTEEKKAELLSVAEDYMVKVRETFREDFLEAQARAVKLNIDWTRCSLEKVDYQMEKEKGVEIDGFTTMTIRFRSSGHPGQIFALGMDDGRLVGGGWLFTDKMLHNIHSSGK